MNKIKQKHINKFVRLTDELCKLMHEITEYEPEAYLFVPQDAICLMKGLSHSPDGDPQPFNVVVQSNIAQMSGGDW